jgi:isopenicillin-N N-acyltransferase-like protein
VPLVITLHGDGRTRGEAHGEAARDLVVEAADRWCAGAHDADTVLDGLVDRSGFLRTARRLTPSLFDEVEGVARASGVDRRVVWALNLLDEDWWMRRRLTAGAGCSVVGMPPGSARRPLLAQNMDLPRWVDGLQVLLDVRPSDGGARLLAPSYAGMAATMALNEHGLGVCVNALSQLPTSADGLPVAFLIREVAAQRCVEHARRVLWDWPHASGQNYVVGDGSSMVGLECSAVGATPYPPVAGLLLHTNHVLGAAPPAEGGVVAGSGERLEALTAGAARWTNPGVHDVMALLSRAPLRRDRDGHAAFTFSAAVMELGADPALHLCDGPPERTNFRRHSFT